MKPRPNINHLLAIFNQHLDLFLILINQWAPHVIVEDDAPLLSLIADIFIVQQKRIRDQNDLSHDKDDEGGNDQAYLSAADEFYFHV